MATQFIIRSTSLAILSYFHFSTKRAHQLYPKWSQKTSYWKGVGKGRISRMNMEYDKAASRNAFFTDYHNAKTENRNLKQRFPQNRVKFKAKPQILMPPSDIFLHESFFAAVPLKKVSPAFGARKMVFTVNY